MKRIIILFTVLFFIGCYNSNRFIEIRQKECECSVGISFYMKKKKIHKGSLSFKNTIIIKNPTLNFVDIDFYYHLGKGEEEYSTDVTLLDFDKKYFFKNQGKRTRIRLNPLSEKKVTYFMWKPLGIIDFNADIYRGLKQYTSLAKESRYEGTLDYDEEPYLEFKRKNPELLEFLTKGDSIELEVVSPVKQKYKFKAEW